VAVTYCRNRLGAILRTWQPMMEQVMADNDIAYFRKRLAEERAQEAGASSSDVRSVHSKLAELYAQRLSGLEADGPTVMSLARTA